MELPEGLRAALASVRDAAHGVITALGGSSSGAARTTTPTRRLGGSARAAPWRTSTTWPGLCSRRRGLGDVGRSCRRALSRASAGPPQRRGCLAGRTAGTRQRRRHLGDADPRQGLRPCRPGIGLSGDDRDRPQEGGWTAEDVGSPSTSPGRILYIADDLPRPVAMVRASRRWTASTTSSGRRRRALALFSSWRGVEAAAERLAELSDIEVIVQRRGDAVGHSCGGSRRMRRRCWSGPCRCGRGGRVRRRLHPRDDRSDSVPQAQRPAGAGAVGARRAQRRQRVHGSFGAQGVAPARAGSRAPDPQLGGSRRRGGARSSARDGPVRRGAPAIHAAAVVHPRLRRRGRGVGAAGVGGRAGTTAESLPGQTDPSGPVVRAAQHATTLPTIRA